MNVGTLRRHDLPRLLLSAFTGGLAAGRSLSFDLCPSNKISALKIFR